MISKSNISKNYFTQWLRVDIENKLLLQISIATIIIQFILFKLFYPYPNFMPPDSYSYIEAASNNQIINIWAIGYSKFLRLFSSITNSHIALVSFQYLLLELSLLYMLFTIRFLFTPSKYSFRIILFVCILNPLLSHISNFISSDSLFTSLSLIWFTQLLWILYLPKIRLVVLHAVVLLFAFMVRYNALYYPFVSIVILSIANFSNNKLRIVGITSILFLLGAFISQTRSEYKMETGSYQFSAFGGWQIAANALYGYAHATPDISPDVPEEFKQLHMLVNHHMDSIRRLNIRPDRDVSIYYLWDFKSPLIVFMNAISKADRTIPYFHRWASVAPLYSAYGRYLIQKYPGAFLNYYLWPNLTKYYAPPVGFLGYYNLGSDLVEPKAARWFGWKTNNIHNAFNDKEIEITEIFPILSAIINIVFVASFISFIILHGFRTCGAYKKTIIWCMLIIWLVNMLFSVFSAPIELRYQLFPLTITSVFLILFLEFIIRESKSDRNI